MKNKKPKITAKKWNGDDIYIVGLFLETVKLYLQDFQNIKFHFIKKKQDRVMKNHFC